MSRLAALREGVRAAVFRRRDDRELDEELAFHLEMEEASHRRAGVAAGEARRRARIAFGGVDRAAEEVREARGTAWLVDLFADLRFAVRTFRRSPGFTAAALLTLMLGIGANAAMFGLVDGILLRPLPYPEPKELVRFYQASPGEGVEQATFSALDFEDWRRSARSFEAMAAFVHFPQIVTGRGEPIEIGADFVTEDYFRVLGTPARLGRPLDPSDLEARALHVVLGERLWRTLFAADPDAIGQSLTLNGETFTIVGVMPASLRFSTPDTDLWVPYSTLDAMEIGEATRDNRHLEGVARLAPGATVERAGQELSALAARLAALHPATNVGWDGATVLSLRETTVGDVEDALLVVLAVVGFILLIGCVNLANLLLARGTARSREMAIRTALGAPRRRIVRQLETESLVLAVAGAALGIAASAIAVDVVLSLGAGILPRAENVALDGRVIGFGLLLAVATALVFGLFPAWRTARVEPQTALRGGRGEVAADGGRLRAALVVVEVALAVVLVIGAGLMTRSFLSLLRVEPGFEPERALTVAMQINIAGVPGDGVAQHLVQRREDLIERVRALPGVVEVGMTNVFPIQDAPNPLWEFAFADGRGAGDDEPLRADLRYVNPSWFRAMGIPLVAGEGLPESWPEDAPVPMLVDRTAARRLWRGDDPIGTRIDAGWGEAVVVGVVGDVRQVALAREPAPTVYLPHAIAPRIMATMAVRTEGDPLALVEPVRQAFHEVAPDQPIRSIETLEEVVARSLARDRFFTVLFAVFAGLALTLAAIGVYGVLAYAVGRRTQEIGVRMALGASAGGVLRMVVGEGARLVAAGVALGTVAALLLSRALASQLYAVGATDPASFAAALVVLAAVALTAAWLPARRASRIDPGQALRSG
ncbi:MAG TPA: ABC transporter permease [Thermoanaerobaculia bacterium]|nr:ABC transporter permease [Thermoanaerobaculia bacterium]